VIIPEELEDMSSKEYRQSTCIRQDTEREMVQLMKRRTKTHKDTDNFVTE
jgi:hypothetical protein